jgi:hypothetical protein
MSDDTTPAARQPVKTSLSPRALALDGVWHLVPDASLRTRTGLVVLAVAALIGATLTLGGISMAGGPSNSPLLAAYIASLCRSSLGTQAREEALFLGENQAAMTTMMIAMDIRPSGDVDADFVATMVPHHQGAIDMAVAVLRYGRNEQIRRLAQEIIVTQQQEIATMRLALGQPLPPSVPSPTQVPSVRQLDSKPNRSSNPTMEP